METGTDDGLRSGASGRPRDPRVDEAVMKATMELLREVGYAKLYMQDVAVRAGVSKASVYRRWSAKGPLVAAAMWRWSMEELPVDVDTGSVRGDMLVLLRAAARTDPPDVSGAESVTAELLADPEYLAAARGALTAQMLAPLRAIVRRGMERGELPEDTDVELLADVGPALLTHRVLIAEPVGDELVVRIVDQFFRGSDARRNS